MISKANLFVTLHMKKSLVFFSLITIISFSNQAKAIVLVMILL